MLIDVVEAKPTEGHRLWLRFADGAAGELDIAAFVRLDGVFAPLRDPAFFRAVRVDPEAGTIVWPNGADLDPDVLYARVTGEPIDIAAGHAA
jgi:hypothetical protein